MNFADPSTVFLAAAGGHTVKLFDASVESGDPCTLSYTPSPGFQVNSLRWNHTNLVVASAGDDKKISLWLENGESMGTIPMAGTDTATLSITLRGKWSSCENMRFAEEALYQMAERSY